MRYSSDFDASDAADEKASEARNTAIENCMEEDKGFAWRWRIVKSATAKLPSLRVTDPKKAKSLSRRIRHLETYCEDSIKEELESMADSESERKDPYAYRGLSRSMFM